ncbi:MAG: InlB B-repeat-containing protein [Candidatus Riflebacteria bacterium]|nr:InlB B-repeat-containing protein [Candidatus Riflebacteria bacterium]
MSRNYLILLIIAGFVGLLLGCHAGGNSPMAPDNSATTVSPETRTVGTNGRFTDITFPSGAVIKCPSDSTFQEGVKVTATEEKVPVITDNSGKFSYIYVYNISAVLPSENSLTADVPVNTIEKPLSVTLPNDSTAGTCYIGTRASDKDPWRYSLATDGIVSNARFMRLSANSPKTFTFNLFRLNIQFRLFVFDNEEKKDEVQVDTIAMVPAEDVEIKDGKYTGKLTVKLNVEGENLKGLKSEDLIAKITYRSENQQGANIDFTTNKNDSSDKAVTGSYEHSFEVSNIKVENTLGNTAELSFELNLDGVSLDDFPKDFLVEFYSKGSDENTRPFEYTQAFSFETREQTDTQTDTDTNTESGTDTQTNTDSGTETNTESSTDTGSSIDTGSATDTGSSTSTGSSTDTGSGTGTDTSVETYSITYELDGGEPTGSNPTSYDENTDDISLSNPTKEGYTFTGWTGTDLDNPTTQVIIEKGSTGNREYTANWKQNAADEFTLSLVAGTGIASVDEEKAYKKATSITLNCTVKDGYEFVNWTDSNGNAVTSPFTMPEKAVTLTANAKVITYNLEYFLDGGNFEKDNPKTYTVETENFDLNDPKKDGYAFLGWTSSEITAPLTPVSIMKGSTGDKKFIANYSPINYTLTYNLDGGQLTKDNPTEYTVETKTFTLTEPTNVGYTFIGWTGSNGDTPQKPVSVVQGSKSDLNNVANYSI